MTWCDLYSRLQWVNETQVDESEGSSSDVGFGIKKFGLCPREMSEYIPCLEFGSESDR